MRRVQSLPVRLLVADAVASFVLGLYGEPRVNVLLLNLAMDEREN